MATAFRFQEKKIIRVHTVLVVSSQTVFCVSSPGSHWKTKHYRGESIKNKLMTGPYQIQTKLIEGKRDEKEKNMGRKMEKDKGKGGKNNRKVPWKDDVSTEWPPTKTIEGLFNDYSSHTHTHTHTFNVNFTLCFWVNKQSQCRLTSWGKGFAPSWYRCTFYSYTHHQSFRFSHIYYKHFVSFVCSQLVPAATKWPKKFNQV